MNRSKNELVPEARPLTSVQAGELAGLLIDIGEILAKAEKSHFNLSEIVTGDIATILRRHRLTGKGKQVMDAIARSCEVQL